MSNETNTQHVKEFVRERYAGVATRNDGSLKRGGCCGPSTKDVHDALADKLGYAGEDLAGLPEGANLGLSCGNPTAHAALNPGDVVLDLGSGAGFDCFIAGRKVGANGRVIGVDMTPEMLSKARRGLAQYRELTGRDRAPSGRRQLGRRRHLQLRSEPLGR